MYAFVYEMMSRLIAKGIIISYSMRRGGRIATKSIGILSHCDVSGGRYMHTNDAYFAPSPIWFPYELKKIFDRILYELQEYPHHFTFDLDQLDRIFEYRYIQSSRYSFPLPM